MSLDDLNMKVCILEIDRDKPVVWLNLRQLCVSTCVRVSKHGELTASVRTGNACVKVAVFHCIGS